MISLKVLSTAAAMALVLPMVAPTASFAQDPHGAKSNYAGRGAGAVAPAARIGGEAVASDRIEALDAYLCSVVDHGLNASTLAARVVASTGADCGVVCGDAAVLALRLCAQPRTGLMKAWMT